MHCYMVPRLVFVKAESGEGWFREDGLSVPVKDM
jgi:hypothetical protein